MASDWRLGQYRQARAPEFIGLYGPHGQNKVFRGQVLTVVLHHPRYISQRREFIGKVIKDEILVEGFDGPLRRHEIRLQVILPKVEPPAEIWLTGPYIEEERRPVGLWRLSHAVGLGPDELPPEYDLTHVSVFEHTDPFVDKREEREATRARAAVYGAAPEHPKRSLFSWMFGGEPSYHFHAPPPPPRAVAQSNPRPPAAPPRPAPAPTEPRKKELGFFDSFMKSYREKREADRLRAEASRAAALALDKQNKAHIQQARKIRQAEAEAKGLLTDYGHLIKPKKEKKATSDWGSSPSFSGAGKAFKLGGRLSASDARKLGKQLDERPFDVQGKFCAFCHHH